MMPGLQAQEMIDFPAQPITEFPFQMLTGGVIIISAKVDVIPDSLHFVLDTGSGGISLDSSTVEIYNVETEPSDRIIRGIAGIRKVEFANNLKLFLPGLTVEGLNFHVNDYQILTEVHGMKIDGIIGYSLLSRYIVKVDYDKKTISILEPGYIRYPRGGTVLKPTLGTIPIVRATSLSAREIYARYYFDTGAGLNVLFNSAFVRDSSIFSKTAAFTPPWRRAWVVRPFWIWPLSAVSASGVILFAKCPFTFLMMILMSPPILFLSDSLATTSCAALTSSSITRRAKSICCPILHSTIPLIIPIPALDSSTMAAISR